MKGSSDVYTRLSSIETSFPSASMDEMLRALGIPQAMKKKWYSAKSPLDKDDVEIGMIVAFIISLISSMVLIAIFSEWFKAVGFGPLLWISFLLLGTLSPRFFANRENKKRTRRNKREKERVSANVEAEIARWSTQAKREKIIEWWNDTISTEREEKVGSNSALGERLSVLHTKIDEEKKFLAIAESSRDVARDQSERERRQSYVDEIKHRIAVFENEKTKLLSARAEADTVYNECRKIVARLDGAYSERLVLEQLGKEIDEEKLQQQTRVILFDLRDSIERFKESLEQAATILQVGSDSFNEISNEEYFIPELADVLNDSEEVGTVAQRDRIRV